MDDSVQEMEVLLVEDNPTDAELTIRALKKLNFANKLVWLKDGAEALDFIFATGAYSARKENSADLILLDLRLPKVDGMELLRRVKNDERTRNIPVVVLTSSKEDRDMAESAHLGAINYISKPLEFDEFSKRVAELGLFWMLVSHPSPGYFGDFVTDKDRELAI